MKLISLNTWGGKVFDPLITFIKDYANNTDIFCLQEVFNTKSDIKNYHGVKTNLLDELKKILPAFSCFYSSEIINFDSCPHLVNFDLTVGKAIFIKNTFNITSQDELLIWGNKDERALKKDFSNFPLILQYIDFQSNGKFFTVCNFHGASYPGSKLDTPLRINQSRKINQFLKDKKGAGKILAGDLNLLPQTQSIQILTQDMRNLISECNIERTRSNLSPFFNKPDFQKYADYVFVSKDIRVEKFEVPNLRISDHLPMILEFN